MNFRIFLSWPLLPLVLAASCARPSQEPTNRDPSSSAERSEVEEAFAESLEHLRRAFGPSGRVERRGAFAIGTPDDAAIWKRYVDGTLLGAAQRLGVQFFAQHPTGPIEVYLFDGASTYQAGVLALTGHEPTTPYGFYESDERRLILDIATGGGTLVHELVHALADVDCPTLPAWINEGLGSLYEACRFEDQRLIGTLNWRFPVLKRAWEAGDWEPTLTELPTLTDREFYGVLSGRHYALARYAMFYLQDRGKLEVFYKSYRQQEPADPTGKLALEHALGGELGEHTAPFQAFLKQL